MLFSVILPIYNVEAYLRECIESILLQSYNNYELILVDDGSKDSSPVICDEYKEKYTQIKVIHKENGGLSDARNVGTLHAQGDYVIYIDSDDFILSKDFLKKIAEKTEKHPDLIFYKYAKYYNENGKLDECKFSYEAINPMDDFATKIKSLVETDSFYGMAWIKAIKRDMLVKNQIEFEKGLTGEDMEWNYNIVCHAKTLECIDEVFVAYRQREGSITSTHKIKNLTDFIYILNKWSSNIQKIDDENLKVALLGSLAKYYSNLYIMYARLVDNDKKKYISDIKKMDWIFKYSLSKRPKMLGKIYKIFKFKGTIKILNLVDKIK